MADAGIKASVADTGLRNMYLALTGAKSAKAKAILDSMRKTFEKRGIAYTLPNVIRQLKMAYKDSFKLAQVFKILFTERGVAHGLVLARDIDKFDKMNDKLHKVTEDSLHLRKEILLGDVKEYRLMQAAWDDMVVMWGKKWVLAFRPMFALIDENLDNMTKIFADSSRFESIAESMVRAFRVMKPLLKGIGLIIEGWARIFDGLMKVMEWIMNAPSALQDIAKAKMSEHLLKNPLLLVRPRPEPELVNRNLPPNFVDKFYDQLSEGPPGLDYMSCLLYTSPSPRDS